jgi:hypothetical protein
MTQRAAAPATPLKVLAPLSAKLQLKNLPALISLPASSTRRVYNDHNKLRFPLYCNASSAHPPIPLPTSLRHSIFRHRHTPFSHRNITSHHATSARVLYLFSTGTIPHLLLPFYRRPLRTHLAAFRVPRTTLPLPLEALRLRHHGTS